MKSVLVVCIGNICRSPIAEELLRAMLPAVEIRSAGLSALVGHKADPLAQQVISRRANLSLDAHRARQINRELCLSSDVILVMSIDQRITLERLYPQTRGKVFRLSDASGEDIPDPYRKDIAVFEKVFSMIEAGVVFWSRRIKMVNEQHDVN